MVTLVCKKKTYYVKVRKHKDKRHYYELKIEESTDSKSEACLEENFGFESPNERLSIAISTQPEGLYITTNHTCFLVETTPADLKQIIIGNSIKN